MGSSVYRHIWHRPTILLVTIKPERLLELCFERDLVGGGGLTLLATHTIVCYAV